MRLNTNDERNIVNNGNGIYNIIIESTDYDGMEMAFDGLTGSHRRSRIGSGYDILDGIRDHHFIVRGFDRAKYIVENYRRLIRRRKRGGFKVFQYPKEEEID